LEIKIILNSEDIGQMEFKELLKKQLALNNINVVLEIRKNRPILRGIDPTILVALVGTLGTGLGALITGILQVLKQTAMQKIIIQTENGSKFDIPADMSPEKLDILIEKIKKVGYHP